jgi:anaerobic selenocysteine-containing dehydrogenase
MFINAGNPVLSIAGEAETRRALEGLELLICVDIYRNATGEYAHYVLPAAGAYEREDINITGLGMQFQPSVQFTEAVVPAAFDRRPEWWIYEKLCSAMGFASAFDNGEPEMWSRIDAMLRSQGRSMEQLRAEQIIALERSKPEDFYGQYVQSDDGLVDCMPEAFADGVQRMEDIFDQLSAEPENQLKLITKRDRYMLNSWYSNVAKLKTGDRDRNYLYMHPEDAAVRQIADGDRVRISNVNGEISSEARLTTELIKGVVAMTHGWGHGRTPGMRIAHEKPGANCNALLPSGPGSFDPLSNQAHMTGVPVEVAPVA